jgi:hypothetical protein
MKRALLLAVCTVAARRERARHHRLLCSRAKDSGRLPRSTRGSRYPVQGEGETEAGGTVVGQHQLRRRGCKRKWTFITHVPRLDGRYESAKHFTQGRGGQPATCQPDRYVSNLKPAPREERRPCFFDSDGKFKTVRKMMVRAYRKSPKFPNEISKPQMATGSPHSYEASGLGTSAGGKLAARRSRGLA